MSAIPEFRECFEVDGQAVTIRTMHPQDSFIEDEFVKSLSDESRYYRFHGTMQELSPRLLEHFTNPHYPDEMALIATVPRGDGEREIGVVRYARTEVSQHAEVAIVVADEWQGRGIGTRMMMALRDIARDAGYLELEVNILRENRCMLGLAKHLGYLKNSTGSDMTSVVLGKNVNKKDAEPSQSREKRMEQFP